MNHKLPTRYVISTSPFDTLEQALNKIKEWAEDDDLVLGTRVWEVTGEVYEVKESIDLLLNKELTYPKYEVSGGALVLPDRRVKKKAKKK